MNDTIRSILGILEDGRVPELRIAAAQILGELGVKDQTLVHRLAQRLEAGEPYLARPVISALGRIGSPAAVRSLVAQLDRTEHADLAAHQLAEIGPPVAEPLAEGFDSAGPEARVRLVSILGRLPCPPAFRVLEQALVDPQLSRRAAESILTHHLEALDSRRSKAFKERLVKQLKVPDLPAQSVATILDLMTRLDASGSRPTLLEHAGPSYPGLVRKAALEALNGSPLTSKQAGELLAYVDDPDDVHVVDPVIRVLSAVESWPAAARRKLCALLVHEDARLRLFAARAMRSDHHEDAVKPLIEHLDGSDRELREAAVRALGANPAARDPLLRALAAERNIDRCRRLAEAASEHFAGLDDKATRSLLDKACKLVIAHDPRGEVLFDGLTAAQSEAVPALVVDKAIRLRRQRKFSEAVVLLALLARAERLDPEGRYQLALSRLLLDSGRRRASDEDEPGDATMGHLAVLVREGFPLLDRLRKEAMLKPEDLLRVGQHFAEAVGDERRFGAEVLRHVAEKHGRHRSGEQARLALRAEGL